MKEFFAELFAYSHHYNQILAARILAGHKSLSSETIRIFSHILNAHQIWNSRISKDQVPFGVWEVHRPEIFAVTDLENYNKSLEILASCDLEMNVSYSNSAGKAFENNVKDILFHVLNHSTYHRGQVASHFRQSGLEPEITDYIMYKRK